LTVNAGSPDSVRVPQLWEVVAGRIRSEILDGTLPPGSKLIESELADRFGTSRGPVREAIRELAREGLVAELARRGTVVSTLTARDLAEVYAIRQGLELTASRAVIDRASDDELSGLVEPLRAMEAARRSEADYGAVAEHDFAFHRRFVALAGNRRMAGINDTMLAQTALLLRTAAEANPTLRSDLDRPVHDAMLDALRARDIRRAQEAVEEHYRYAEERLFAQFAGR
jgi:DNA-binding GntR family transcriptional regulator